ncbi:MAG: hypothetical protein QMC59_02260 [Candidatus Poseidoniaceae archaeon]|jgi:hypothetical protein|tara:strand:- start:5470 stop:7902 length:2433 start_codon:yes stop_codon:yes gene_type:complete
MKRFLALLIAFTMLPLVALGPVVAASDVELIDAGYTHQTSNKLVHWEVMNDGTVLTVDVQGNLTVNAFSKGILVPLWNLDLDVSANGARLDDAQLLTAVAHDAGVFVVHMDLQIANRNISTDAPVNDMDWDSEGDLWLAHFAGRRRAEEYASDGATGTFSPPVQSGFNSFTVLDDGRMALGGYDSKVYVADNGGTLLTTLTEPGGIVNALIQDHDGNLIVGSSNGAIYRYDTNSWAVETLALSHGSSIIHLEELDNSTYIAGSQNGKLTMIDGATFAEGETYVSQGAVTGSASPFTGEVYIVTSFLSYSKIRLYDLDTDGDGVTDTNDVFPNEITQWSDADLDGYGDNINGFMGDRFPSDGTQYVDADGDGHGDNPAGTEGDLFPNNAEQWQDMDGDGYGDNEQGLDGDMFPEEPTQWMDSDLDGYGSNPNGLMPDACPTTNGFSKYDRYGCSDTDLDGYSNPDESFGVEQGADALPSQGTQWLDQDGDGFGDNTSGLLPDACPWEFGNSTRAWIPNATSASGFIEVASNGCEDLDGDGWVDRTESIGMETDPDEHFDADKDGVGSNSDYDDSRPLVQTETDHCMLNFDDLSDACMGWRSEDYQSYLSREKDANESDYSYAAWNASKNAGLLDSGSEVDSNTLKQVIAVGGVAFALLSLVIVGVAAVSKRRKSQANIKIYGTALPPNQSTKSASVEALEGTAGLSAQGGVESDSAWDDDVVSLDFTVNDGDLDVDDESSESIDASSLYGEDDSLEAIAGMPAPVAAEKPTSEEAAEVPAAAPPIPASGLPEGWTMDQWKWYGQEWLDKQK